MALSPCVSNTDAEMWGGGEGRLVSPLPAGHCSGRGKASAAQLRLQPLHCTGPSAYKKQPCPSSFRRGRLQGNTAGAEGFAWGSWGFAFLTGIVPPMLVAAVCGMLARSRPMLLKTQRAQTGKFVSSGAAGACCPPHSLELVCHRAPDGNRGYCRPLLRCPGRIRHQGARRGAGVAHAAADPVLELAVL